MFCFFSTRLHARPEQTKDSNRPAAAPRRHHNGDGQPDEVKKAKKEEAHHARHANAGRPRARQRPRDDQRPTARRGDGHHPAGPSRRRPRRGHGRKGMPIVGRVLARARSRPKRPKGQRRTRFIGWAARTGNLDVVKWARAQGCPWDAETCAEAARGGHLHVLAWLHDNGCPWANRRAPRRREADTSR